MASERERFEEWLRSAYGPTENLSVVNGVYADRATLLLFTGWKARARIAEQREAELVEALGAYYQEAVSTVTRNISPVCPSIETHNKMLEALAKHKAEGREGS